MENLYLTVNTSQRLCSALPELSGEGVTGVIPALQNLFLSDEYPLGGAIKIFVAARWRSGHRVSVHRGSRRRGWKDITEDVALEDW